MVMERPVTAAEHRPPDEIGKNGLTDRFAMWRVPVTDSYADARVVVSDNPCSRRQQPLRIMLRAEKIHPDDVTEFVVALEAAAAWIRERGTDQQR